MEAGTTDMQPGAAARRLIRSRSHAALATLIDGRPYVSLVAIACEVDASPLLLLSDLAQHTANLAADPRMSLLFEDTAGHSDPLAGPRLTLLGRAERCAAAPGAARAAARFAARHPVSATYAGFADFHLYRVVAERGHLVAGFGRTARIEAEQLRFTADVSALAAAESMIVAHMNEDHADAIALYAQRLLGRSGTGWHMTGIDPEGIDLQRPAPARAETARLPFCQPVTTPETARRTLVALADKARDSANRG